MKIRHPHAQIHTYTHAHAHTHARMCLNIYVCMQLHNIYVNIFVYTYNSVRRSFMQHVAGLFGVVCIGWRAEAGTIVHM